METPVLGKIIKIMFKSFLLKFKLLVENCINNFDFFLVILLIGPPTNENFKTIKNTSQERGVKIEG